jgi:hypothetical protein
MLWVLTGSRPDTLTSSCRAKSYKKLCEKMIVAQVRHKRCIGDGKYQEVVQKLCRSNLTDESLMVIALPLGFEAVWLEKARTARKGSGLGVFGQATLSMASQQRQEVTMVIPEQEGDRKDLVTSIGNLFNKFQQQQMAGNGSDQGAAEPQTLQAQPAQPIQMMGNGFGQGAAQPQTLQAQPAQPIQMMGNGFGQGDAQPQTPLAQPARPLPLQNPIGLTQQQNIGIGLPAPIRHAFNQPSSATESRLGIGLPAAPPESQTLQAQPIVFTPPQLPLQHHMGAVAPLATTAASGGDVPLMQSLPMQPHPLPVQVHLPTELAELMSSPPQTQLTSVAHLPQPLLLLHQQQQQAPMPAPQQQSQQQQQQSPAPQPQLTPVALASLLQQQVLHHWQQQAPMPAPQQQSQQQQQSPAPQPQLTPAALAPLLQQQVLHQQQQQAPMPAPQQQSQQQQQSPAPQSQQQQQAPTPALTTPTPIPAPTPTPTPTSIPALMVQAARGPFLASLSNAQVPAPPPSPLPIQAIAVPAQAAQSKSGLSNEQYERIEASRLRALEIRRNRLRVQRSDAGDATPLSQLQVAGEGVAADTSPQLQVAAEGVAADTSPQLQVAAEGVAAEGVAAEGVDAEGVAAEETPVALEPPQELASQPDDYQARFAAPPVVDTLMCIICRDDLNLRPVQAVPGCLHTYHADCLLAYMDAKGVSFLESCPLNCMRGFRLSDTIDDISPIPINVQPLLDAPIVNVDDIIENGIENDVGLLQS